MGNIRFPPKGGGRENVTALQVFLLCLWQGDELKSKDQFLTSALQVSLVIYCLVLRCWVASAETDTRRSPIVIYHSVFNKVLPYKWMGNIVKVPFCFEDQNNVVQVEGVLFLLIYLFPPFKLQNWYQLIFEKHWWAKWKIIKITLSHLLGIVTINLGYILLYSFIIIMD